MLGTRWAPVLLVFHTCLGDRRGLSRRCALPKANLTPGLGTLMVCHTGHWNSTEARSSFLACSYDQCDK